MSGVPSTPRPKSTLEPTTPAAESTQRPAAVGSHLHVPSPHYQTTRRHSLYGTEDRVVLDPGSRVWKVGFSGEGRPRDVFTVGYEGSGLWELTNAENLEEKEEKQHVLEAEVQKHLRYVFHKHVDFIVIVENPLIPVPTKELLARVLFDNLQVPSLSFTSSHLLSLLAVGRISGLVLDAGHLESVVLPVVSSRPLYSCLKSTPLAGSALTSHLRHLLLKYGSYIPPTPLSGAAIIRPTRVPEELLTDALLEEIKTRCCFVAAPLSVDDTTPMVVQLGDSMLDNPNLLEAMEASSVNDDTETMYSSAVPESHQSSYDPSPQAIFDIYMRNSNTKTLSMKVLPSTNTSASNVRATLVIPGWVRERAAEYLFQGDIDESSVAEVVLDSLLKIPRDLRKSMISSILVVGGTAMLPGFISRLNLEIVRALTSRDENNKRKKRLPYNPYRCLQPLLPYVGILNSPSLAPSTAKVNLTKAPAFSPAALPWIGGSLAGSLKTGGSEITRERWDEVDQDYEEAETSNILTVNIDRNPIPDWSRVPLSSEALSFTPSLPSMVSG
ncbi:hypothetical protein Clacol_002576 [Clathrus columnatus]|uniref:Actin-related protein 10 n=1 Tax=Clathrus columnatus TaxID=1419009 RepID=A0AAV5A416_9AGAM|nr:hypothetical protein Clacol_002576 [Clathrus columnatus]